MATPHEPCPCRVYFIVTPRLRLRVRRSLHIQSARCTENEERRATPKNCWTRWVSCWTRSTPSSLSWPTTTLRSPSAAECHVHLCLLSSPNKAWLASRLPLLSLWLSITADSANIISGLIRGTTGIDCYAQVTVALNLYLGSNRSSCYHDQVGSLSLHQLCSLPCRMGLRSCCRSPNVCCTVQSVCFPAAQLCRIMVSQACVAVWSSTAIELAPAIQVPPRAPEIGRLPTRTAMRRFLLATVS